MIMKVQAMIRYDYEMFKLCYVYMIYVKRDIHIMITIHGIFTFMHYYYSLSNYLMFSKINFRKLIRGVLEGSYKKDLSFVAKGHKTRYVIRVRLSIM